jgi:hypothetical protein
MAYHACFLRETGDFFAKSYPVWGKQAFSPNPNLRHSAPVLLPEFEPGLMLILGENQIDDFKLILIDVTPYFKAT